MVLEKMLTNKGLGGLMFKQGQNILSGNNFSLWGGGGGGGLIFFHSFCFFHYLALNSYLACSPSVCLMIPGWVRVHLWRNRKACWVGSGNPYHFLLMWCQTHWSQNLHRSHLLPVTKQALINTVKPDLVTTCLQRPHFLFPLKMVSYWNMY